MGVARNRGLSRCPPSATNLCRGPSVTNPCRGPLCRVLQSSIGLPQGGFVARPQIRLQARCSWAAAANVYIYIYICAMCIYIYTDFEKDMSVKSNCAASTGTSEDPSGLCPTHQQTTTGAYENLVCLGTYLCVSEDLNNLRKAGFQNQLVKDIPADTHHLQMLWLFGAIVRYCKDSAFGPSSTRLLG